MKTIGWIISAIICFLIFVGLYSLWINNNSQDYNQEKGIQDNYNIESNVSNQIEQSKVYGNCPEEFDKDIVSITAPDLVTEFPQSLYIYARDYAQDKGSFMQLCRVGSNVGENVNWVYCDTNGYLNEPMTYTRTQQIDSNGVIQPKGKTWKVTLIFDYRTCQVYRPADGGKMLVNLYKCNITKLSCS